MVKEMGKGIREIEIWFDYPITVTQRYDEGLLTHKNFTNQKIIENDQYPEGAFAYSQTVPMVLNF